MEREEGRGEWRRKRRELKGKKEGRYHKTLGGILGIFENF